MYITYFTDLYAFQKFEEDDPKWLTLFDEKRHN